MHSFMNSRPLEYSPATFTFVEAPGNAGTWGEVSVLALTL